MVAETIVCRLKRYGIVHETDKLNREEVHEQSEKRINDSTIIGEIKHKILLWYQKVLIYLYFNKFTISYCQI